jgi:hypothetical protein
MTNKKCCKCKFEKPISEFSKATRKPDGLRVQCKLCDSNYRKLNKEYRNNWNKEFRGRRWDYNVFQSARVRARQRGLDFNLKLEDIKIPDVCPILGIKIIKGNNRREEGSPSIDRIDNSKGYVNGNILITSWRANKLKGDSNQEERRRITQFYERFEK